MEADVVLRDFRRVLAFYILIDSSQSVNKGLGKFLPFLSD